MAINIQNAFTTDRQIAQGEAYCIYFRILPSPIDRKIDLVYAETDEGFTSTQIEEPLFGETMYVLFDGDTTKQFREGDHHVRMWAVEDGLKYVLFETLITVNPGFPFTENTQNLNYTYKSKFLKDTQKIDVPTVSADGAIQKIQTYPIFRGKIDSPFSFAGITQSYEVPDVSQLPEKANKGDLCMTQNDGLWYICVDDDNPAVWARITELIFTGDREGLVPSATEDEHNKFLKADGSWSLVGRESLVTDDFILNQDAVDIICDIQ